MPCRWFRLHASMKRLIGNRAAVFDVTLHYKHRDALAVAREHKRLIWFLKADLPAMNVQGKDHGSVKPTLTYERGALIREEVQTFSLWPLLLNGYRYSKARGVHVQHQCSGCGS